MVDNKLNSGLLGIIIWGIVNIMILLAKTLACMLSFIELLKKLKWNSLMKLTK